MAGDAHGDKTQEEPQTQEDLGQQQAAQDQPQVSGIRLFADVMDVGKQVRISWEGERCHGRGIRL